jgi:hypothetical protein
MRNKLRNSIHTLIDPPKRGKKTNRQGHTVQRVIVGHYTGNSNSVNVRLPGLSEFLDCGASMVCVVSVRDISRSRSPSGRCDEFIVSWNRIVVGTTSDMTPPVMAQDLC